MRRGEEERWGPAWDKGMTSDEDEGEGGVVLRIRTRGRDEDEHAVEMNPKRIRQILVLLHTPLLRGNESSWEGNFINRFLASSLNVEMRGTLYFTRYMGLGEGDDAVWRSGKTIESHIRECLTINCGCNAYRIRVTVFTICKLA